MLAELNLRLDYLLQMHLHDDAPNDAVALKERTGLMGEDSAALYDSITHRLFVLCGYAAMTGRSRRNSRTISLPRFRSHTASALIDTVLASLVRAGSPNSTVLQRSP